MIVWLLHTDSGVNARRQVGDTFRLKVPNQTDVGPFPFVVPVSEAGGWFPLSALLVLNIFDLSFWDVTD